MKVRIEAEVVQLKSTGEYEWCVSCRIRGKARRLDSGIEPTIEAAWKAAGVSVGGTSEVAS
jgi:hypothetical protein